MSPRDLLLQWPVILAFSLSVGMIGLAMLLEIVWYVRKKEARQWIDERGR